MTVNRRLGLFHAFCGSFASQPPFIIVGSRLRSFDTTVGSGALRLSPFLYGEWDSVPTAVREEAESI